jgi:outer membrane protein assembly factor BamB
MIFRHYIQKHSQLGCAFLISIASLSGMVGLSGCSTLNTQNGVHREFSINSTWVRTTLNSDYLGYRRLNRMSPIVLDKMIIQANAVDGVAAFNRKSGRLIWRMNIENGAEGGAQFVANTGKSISGAGAGGSASASASTENGASGSNNGGKKGIDKIHASDEGRIFLGGGNGQFYCLNALDGQVLWSFPVHAETLSAPTVKDNIVYFQSGTDVVYALDALTGKQLWLYNRQVTNGFSIRASTQPVIDGEQVLVGFSDGFLVALKKHDGGVLWERKLGKVGRFRDVDGTPVVDDKSIFVASFDGSLYSLKRESGEINWEIDEGGYVPVTLGRNRFSDRLYFASTSGRILILDKSSGKQLSSIKLSKGIPTQPEIYRNYIVYGESEGAFVVADADKGTPIGRFDPGHGLVAKPTVIDTTGEAFFISNSANLYAMKLGFVRQSDRLPWQSSVR